MGVFPKGTLKKGSQPQGRQNGQRSPLTWKCLAFCWAGPGGGF